MSQRTVSLSLGMVRIDPHSPQKCTLLACASNTLCQLSVLLLIASASFFEIARASPSLKNLHFLPQPHTHTQGSVWLHSLSYLFLAPNLVPRH